MFHYRHYPDYESVTTGNVQQLTKYLITLYWIQWLYCELYDPVTRQRFRSGSTSAFCGKIEWWPLYQQGQCHRPHLKGWRSSWLGFSFSIRSYGIQAGAALSVQSTRQFNEVLTGHAYCTQQGLMTKQYGTWTNDGWQYKQCHCVNHPAVSTAALIYHTFARTA
jgi:hypothetical protein